MMPNRAVLEEKLNLVLGQLLNLEQPDFVQGENAIKVDASRGIYARDFGIENWDWPQGVGLYGLEKTRDLQEIESYDEFLENWFSRNIEEGLPSKNINTTAPYIVLVTLAQRDGNEVYKEMCLEHAQWLMDELPKTKEGGFQHVTTGFDGMHSLILNESEIWIDTLFMAVLFLAKAGVLFENEEFLNEAARQTLLHIKYLYEKKNGLVYHGWSFNRNDNFGGIFWSRGNAWFSYGILELIETLAGSLDGGTEQFLLDTYKAQMNALMELQAESGLWHTILTDPSSYEEVSGTAGIAAGMLKGMRLGLLDDSFLPCAEKAVSALLQNIKENGVVGKVSSGTGIGLDALHYKNIACAPISYGQSMTAFALIEALLLENE